MKALKKLGLTKYEISIYKSLLKLGKSNAKKISEVSCVPQTAVYPSLKTLVNKQLIQKIQGETSLFAPISPKNAIKNLIKKRKDALENIEQEIISEADKLLKQKMPDSEKEIIQLTRGREFSSAVYNEAIKKVKKTFYIVGWRFEKVGDRYKFLHEYKKIIKKGVDVRILIIGDGPKQEELLRDYIKVGVKMKFASLDNFSILIVDSKECKITLKNKTLPEKYNLHILDESLSEALHNYFLTLWKNAEPINLKPKPQS